MDEFSRVCPRCSNSYAFCGCLIGESVKTKRVEIEIKPEDWEYEDDRFLLKLKLSSEGDDLFCNLHPMDSMTLSFEIPVPERKVEITKGDIHNLRNRFENEAPNLWPENSVKNRLLTFDEFLIRELFGESK